MYSVAVVVQWVWRSFKAVSMAGATPISGSLLSTTPKKAKEESRSALISGSAMVVMSKSCIPEKIASRMRSERSVGKMAWIWSWAVEDA